MNYRNDYRKNVVICGFNETERKSLLMYEASDTVFCEETPYKKCPHIIYIDNVKDAIKRKGLVLFLKVDSNIDLVEFDKKYRNKLDYWYIKLYNEKFQYKDNKYTNISMIGEDEMFSDYYDTFIEYIDKYFFNHKNIKYHGNKLMVLENIHKYLNDKKELCSNEIIDEFNISLRNVERYMNDINNIHNDIGYDYSKNIWYICK